MTVALYARVSTPHQAQTQTIEQQLERLRAWAAAGASAGEQSRSEECLVFRDAGYSGASLHRPGLDALRDAVACARVERVLMTAPDRLARKYVHQALLLEELERGGCVVDFLDRPMSRDPHDQLLLQIRGAVAEYERTLIAERMRRGRLAKLRTGTLLPWTRVPYGYRVDPDRPRDPLGARMDPGEGAVVQDLFVRYLQPGATLQGVVAALVREGVPTPHGGQQWNRSTLRWMLRNPVYLGQVYANRTRARPAHQRHSAMQPIGQQGTTLELTEPESWLLVTTIPPLVSQEVFDQVQVKLAENRRLAQRHNTKGDYLLRALVSCGVCGYACKGRQEPPRYAYYLCAGKTPGRPEHPDGRCPARYIPAQALDDLVWQDLCDVLTHPNSLAQALERAQAGAWLPQELQARRTQLQQGIQQVERQVDRVGDAYQAGAMPLVEYRRRRQRLDDHLSALARQRQQLEAQMDQHQAAAQVMTSIEAFCQRVRPGLAHATFVQRRQLVELLIDRVVATDGDVEIHYVIPTTPASEQVRFSHLRTNYL
ncbi:MAG TPA: recombinase family protein, partial [Ktedonobacterales bacterium]|nr:recombinase family protein [Ktedonobacterales bacterium]